MEPFPIHYTHLSSSLPLTRTHGLLDCMYWLPSFDMLKIRRIPSRNLRNSKDLGYSKSEDSVLLRTHLSFSRLAIYAFRSRVIIASNSASLSVKVTAGTTPPKLLLRNARALEQIRHHFTHLRRKEKHHSPVDEVSQVIQKFTVVLQEKIIPTEGTVLEWRFDCDGPLK